MIRHPERFSQAQPANFDGVFDWDFLIPAFVGTKIEPTDVDAMVERHRKILLFETKEPGRQIPQGQVIALEALLTIGKGNIYLMILYGKTKETIVGMDEWSFNKYGVINKKGLHQCDWNYVLERVKAWFNWANSYDERRN
jgi:hypothetical protein